MSEETMAFCTKAGYVALAVFFIVMLAVFLSIWMKSYWREQEAKRLDDDKISKVQEHADMTVMAWIAVADDRLDTIVELKEKNDRLENEVADLKKLLKLSEDMRLKNEN